MADYIRGALEGLGKGMGIIGQQGVNHQYESMRLELLNELATQRDERNNQAAVQRLEMEQSFRSREDDRTRAHERQQNKGTPLYLDENGNLTEKGSGIPVANRDAGGKVSPISWGNGILGGGTGGSGLPGDHGKVKTQYTDDQGNVHITFEDGYTMMKPAGAVRFIEVALPGQAAPEITESILQEAEAFADSEIEKQAGWMSTDASDFKDFGGSRDKAREALKQQYIASKTGGGAPEPASAPSQQGSGRTQQLVSLSDDAISRMLEEVPADKRGELVKRFEGRVDGDSLRRLKAALNPPKESTPAPDDAAPAVATPQPQRPNNILGAPTQGSNYYTAGQQQFHEHLDRQNAERAVREDAAAAKKIDEVIENQFYGWLPASVDGFFQANRERINALDPEKRARLMQAYESFRSRIRG